MKQSPVIAALAFLLPLLGCGNGSESSGAQANVQGAGGQSEVPEVANLPGAGAASEVIPPGFTQPFDLQLVVLDSELRPYKTRAGVSGSIKSVGSDTMSNLMALWGEGFTQFYPNVQVGIEESGSNTAPPALIEGTAHFGPMSRRMKRAEVETFVERFGFQPTPMAVAIDCLSLFVHKDNPIARRGLSLQEVDSLFSKTRRGGGQPIHTWGDLGLTGAWSNKVISLYGRNSSSGTYAYFKNRALFGGDFKAMVKEQPGSSAVVSGVAQDKLGIGYSGVGYLTPDVVAVPLRREGDFEYFPPLATHAYTGDYPLARFLWLYLNYEPNSELDPLRAQFLSFIYSRDGQSGVSSDGYLPVTAAVARRQLAQVGMDLDDEGRSGE